MTLVLSGERPAAAVISSSPVQRLVAWLGKFRAARAQRYALATLLDLDQHRLEDLGINRSDLFDAMLAEQRPTRLLAERRARRASDYMNP